MTFTFARIRIAVWFGLCVLFGGVFPGAQATETWVGSGQPGQGGVIRNLVTFSTSPVTLYASSAGSGVFRSTDDGANWSAINAGFPLTRVNSIRSVSPSGTHSTATLYAVTDGAGVYRTSTASVNWTAFNTGLGCNYVRTMTVADTAGSQMFVGTTCGGTSGGIYRSSGGGSWTQLNTGANGMPLGVTIYSITSNTTGTSLRVATDGFGVYNSGDSGATWQQKNGTGGNVLSGPNGLNVFDLRVVTAAAGGDLAALVEGGGVFRSSDNGTN